MSIKRYALPPYEDDPYCWSLVESEEGGWVRYEDHAAEVERLLKGITHLRSLYEQEPSEANEHALARAWKRLLEEA